MKILILNQHFKSPQTGGLIRTYYLAKALVDNGHEVVVITGGNEKKYREETLEGIKIHHLPVAYENAFGFGKRSISFLIYVWKSIRLAKKFSNIDLCYAVSAPLTVGLAALYLKKTKNLKFIFEVGDLWPDAPVQMEVVKNYFFVNALYAFEKMIYKEADSIVALSQPIKEAIENKIVFDKLRLTEKKIYIVPNFSDCDFYKPSVKNPMLEEKVGVNGKFVVAYIGAVGVANGLDYFIECANTSRKANLPIHFIICGDGAKLQHLKSVAEKLQLKNISFTGFVNRDGVKELMNVVDAAFVCYKNISILETGSPNKYFDALAAGKLIVINFGGWIKNEIEKMQCGIFVDPKHPTDFIKKIETFVVDKKLLEQYQQASRTLAEGKYERKKLSTYFANLISKR